MASIIRLRLSLHDAHYGGNLVDGARILGLFGDAATELLIKHDEDEGLFVSYEQVEFTAPVYAGDYVEVKGELVHIGNTSRKMAFEAHKIIEANIDPDKPYKARMIPEPILVAKAIGTCVVPKNR
ncbi:3-aminobutyryl-CoA ammonia lyase [Hazenella sp. IB182357]|uniref:3-aminobutyryl-CoA ammonia lyase n=1 Tax=Polycladospora coralii TaxID=2771432 RepID=A0A926N9W1_9BACL|nr:3-aminobutyryl-CoA ammonia lyase [Polycladospora coralii]MBS7530608.1 3-aminobutyryl-CoA ammonia lyase [Polycladospora coralii]